MVDLRNCVGRQNAPYCTKVWETSTPPKWQQQQQQHGSHLIITANSHKQSCTHSFSRRAGGHDELFPTAASNHLGVNGHLGGGELVRPAQGPRVDVEDVHGVLEDDHHLFRVVISGDEDGFDESGSFRRGSQPVLNRQNQLPLQMSLFFVPRPDAEEGIHGTGNGNETRRESFGAAENRQNVPALVVFVQMTPEEMAGPGIKIQRGW